MPCFRVSSAARSNGGGASVARIVASRPDQGSHPRMLALSFRSRFRLGQLQGWPIWLESHVYITSFKGIRTLHWVPNRPHANDGRGKLLLSYANLF